jgi:PPOX class probable F420-dependent enzyme
MARVLPEGAALLLDGANFGYLATLMPDGSPKVEPVWVAREGDMVLVVTDAASIKAKNVARDPRVALTVVAVDQPYEHMLLRGRVIAVRPDDDLAVLDTFSEKYLGRPYPRRRWHRRIVLVIHAHLVRYHPPAHRLPLR